MPRICSRPVSVFLICLINTMVVNMFGRNMDYFNPVFIMLSLLYFWSSSAGVLLYHLLSRFVHFLFSSVAFHAVEQFCAAVSHCELITCVLSRFNLLCVECLLSL